jgi:hypothetical protein
VSTDLDTARIVRSWLRTDEHESADRVLGVVLARMDATPQRHVVRPLRRAGEVDRSTAFLFAGAAVLAIAALVGGSILHARPAPIGVASPSAIDGATPTSSAAPSSTPDASARWTPPPEEPPFQGAIPRGPYELAWTGGPPDARIRVTIPTDGWSWMGSGPGMIYKDHGLLFGFPADLETHTVSQVVTSMCELDAASGEVGPVFVDVGPSVDALVTALVGIDGMRWSDPEPVEIGGYHGMRLVTTQDADCPGPSRRTVWEDQYGYFFVEEEMRSTVDIIDVDGHRLVLTANVRRPEAAAELEAIVASIDIERGQPPLDRPIRMTWVLFPRAVGPDAELRVGRHRAIVEGIRFTFVVPNRHWESQRGFYLVKSIRGPQGAEGTIRWTTIPNGEYTDACPDVLQDSPGQSVSLVANAVASAPGVRVAEGPTDVTIGGRPAAHVVVRVERDLGCDPGYFYTYDAPNGGALWMRTSSSDVISVWIVEARGKLLFIEGEATEATAPTFAETFQQIVDSMQFE